jgi:suppressor for copper-sensitivity B
VVLPIAVTLARPGEAAVLRAEVDYAACKDVCVPYQASLALTLPPGLAVPGPEATLIARRRAAGYRAIWHRHGSGWSAR